LSKTIFALKLWYALQKSNNSPVISQWFSVFSSLWISTGFPVDPYVCLNFHIHWIIA